MRGITPLTGLLATATLVVGLAPAAHAAPTTPPAHGTGGDTPPVVVSGTFAPYTDDAVAVTHDEELVPAGAEVTVTVAETRWKYRKGTRVDLEVAGLVPGHEYGAHLHTDPCGPDPADSGPHYQNIVDPGADGPSVDPRYANPWNEVWLDFTADEAGEGAATATVGWRVRPGEASSVVIHEHHTATGHGEAGTAGARVACVNVPL